MSINDYIRIATTCDIIYIFLYKSFTLIIILDLVYLLKKKTKVLIDILEHLQFEENH